MKTKGMKRLAAALLCLCLILTALSGISGCGKKKGVPGNMDIIGDYEPGKTYAFIKIRDFEGELSFVLFDDIAPVGVETFTDAAENRYYDGKTFHRVLKDTLIQGGALNMDGSDATIPPEEKFEIETHDNARNFFGALCFAPEPESGMNYRQFFIVTANESVDINQEASKIKELLENAGDEDLTKEERKTFQELQKSLSKLPKAVKERYLEQGGIPMIDDTVTVFGQLISGWELLEEISSVQVVAGNKIDDNNPNLQNGKGQNSRPADSVFIESVRIVHIPLEDEEEE